MFPKYPYLDLSDRNLDFLTKAIREMENEVKNFVSLNAVKYANPIQWSINRQYEKNTIVIDPLTGTAFISVQPVPNGVALTRTQYWTPVFDLSQFVTKAASNFANSYERDITTTATIPTGAGDWVVWGSTLYIALTSIHAGDTYVVGGNIKRMTVEDFYDLIMEAIRGLDDRIDVEIENRTNADRSLGGRIDDEIENRSDADTALGDRIDEEIINRTDADNKIIAKIGNLANLTTADKTSVVNAINELTTGVYVNITDFGATPNTDCTAIINEVIANYDYIYIPEGTYYVDASTVRRTFVRNGITTDYCAGVDIYNMKNKHIICQGILKDVTNDGQWAQIVNIQNSLNITWFGGDIVGNKSTHVIDGSEWYHGISICSSDNVIVDNVKIRDIWADGIYTGIFYHDSSGVAQGAVAIKQCDIYNCGRNGISLVSSSNTIIDSCLISKIDRTAPKSGIDIEGEGVGSAQPSLQNITIRNTRILDTEIGVWLSGKSALYASVNFEGVRVFTSHYAFRSAYLENYANGGILTGDISAINNVYGGVIIENPNDEFYFNVKVNVIDCNTSDGTSVDSSGLIVLGTTAYNVNANMTITQKYHDLRGDFHVDSQNAYNVSIHYKSNNTGINSIAATTYANLDVLNYNNDKKSISNEVTNDYSSLRASNCNDVFTLNGLIIPTDAVAADGVLFKVDNYSAKGTYRIGGEYDLTINGTGWVATGTGVDAHARVSINATLIRDLYI